MGSVVGELFGKLQKDERHTNRFPTQWITEKPTAAGDAKIFVFFSIRAKRGLDGKFIFDVTDWILCMRICANESDTHPAN